MKSMTIKELEAKLGAILSALRVEYKKVSLIKDISVQFVLDRFGMIVCAINRMDYKLIDTAVSDQYQGWEVVYITTQDNLDEKRKEVLWSLMRCGYITWLRYSLTDSQFRKLMFESNLAFEIINKRLEIWGDLPKYRYLVECDTFAKSQGRISEYLSKEPGYFDHMPGE